MSTIAKLSNGTLLKSGDGASPEVFTTVPEVMKLAGPSVKFDLLDVGSHSSPSLFREYIPGWSDGESVRASINWRTGNVVQTALRTDAYAATLRNFKIIYPDSPNNTVLMATYIENFPPNADVGKQLTAELSLKITGAPTWS